jgi:class 3 adenylate cyclase
MGFRYHAGAYGLTNGFLVGTWAVTGHGFFWPIFPAMGMGIGLGLHALAAHGHEEHQAERELRRLETGDRALALPPVPAHGPERRFVVVMFTDIANSTRLAEAMGDAEWSRVRGVHQELLRDCLGAHHGSEVGSQGDGLLARFGTPLDAVLCAVDVQRRLHDQRNASGFAPALRIGIHSGDAVEDRDDLVGTAINIAARVVAEAGPGEVVVTEPVADQLDSRFELEDRGLRALKGVTHPRHLLAVRWSE